MRCLTYGTIRIYPHLGNTLSTGQQNRSLTTDDMQKKTTVVWRNLLQKAGLTGICPRHTTGVRSPGMQAEYVASMLELVVSLLWVSRTWPDSAILKKSPGLYFWCLAYRH
jgi:hypothetical protein